MLRLDANDLEIAQRFFSIAVPPKAPFPQFAFAFSTEMSVEGRVLHRFGVAQLAQRFAHLGDGIGALAREVLQESLGGGHGLPSGQPVKRLRCA